MNTLTQRANSVLASNTRQVDNTAIGRLEPIHCHADDTYSD